MQVHCIPQWSKKQTNKKTKTKQQQQQQQNKQSEVHEQGKQYKFKLFYFVV